MSKIVSLPVNNLSTLQLIHLTMTAPQSTTVLHFIVILFQYFSSCIILYLRLRISFSLSQFPFKHIGGYQREPRWQTRISSSMTASMLPNCWADDSKKKLARQVGGRMLYGFKRSSVLKLGWCAAKHGIIIFTQWIFEQICHEKTAVVFCI